MALMPWRNMADEIAAMATPVTGHEQVSLRGALGRIVAADTAALHPLPAQTHAVMDGYALGSAPPGTFHVLPPGAESLDPDQAVAIRTGEPLPHSAAKVVLSHRASLSGQTLQVQATPGKDNIRRVGEEAAAGDIVLNAGTRLDARHLALAAAAGITSVLVRHRPRVALLGLHEGTSGLPHIPVIEALLDSKALDLTSAGCSRNALFPEQLKQLARERDLIVVAAESLGDELGPLAVALQAAGSRVEVRRAAMKPAKPVVTGRIGKATVIGLTGTAYAATIAAHLLLRPLLCRLMGLPARDVWLPAVIGFDRSREPGRAEALPVTIRRQDDRLLAESAGRFGQLKALAAMDGFVLIDADASNILAGQPVLYHPLLMPLV